MWPDWWEEAAARLHRLGTARLCPGVEDNTVARGRINRLLCGLRGRERIGGNGLNSAQAEEEDFYYFSK